ncbi:MAG: type II toxin-antitoxin system ParD family antitoxin [Chloracidobacterium sp.]|nr:type II toxin-antitoxin system ParD family antitoxin [Chloracidobacterium sp.]
MNVSLSPELEQMILAKIQSGMYNTASEVVREGLRLIQQRDEIRAEKLAALRSDVRRGLDDLEGGRYRDGQEVMADLTGRLTDIKRRNG